jgi:hypothetical protein
MKTSNVVLGGQSYTIKALPIRQSKAWRTKLEGPFAELSTALEGAGKIELSSGVDIGRLVRTLSGTLIGSIDLLMDLLFEYSPELAADRERIEEEAFDEEALEALAEVLRLAYPFGRALALVTGRTESKT